MHRLFARGLRLLMLLVPAWSLSFGCSSSTRVEESVGQVTQGVLGNASCEQGLADLSGTVCCDRDCGSCNESGCTARPGGAAKCCPSRIRSAEVACAHNLPPCVQDPDPLCLNGVKSQSGTTCCPDFCGECGGSDCSDRLGGRPLCCYSGITEGGAPTCSGGAAPCLMDTDPLCEFGLEKNGYCCDADCGTCGGDGCSSRPGGRPNCCAGGIDDSGRLCSQTDAPCRMDGDPLCERGILNDSGTACCKASCGRCGGSGCHALPGGAANCCTTNDIEPANLSCVDHEAPCVMNVPKPRTFVHPGLLNTQAELNRIRQRVAIAGDPIRLGWDRLRGSDHAELDYVFQPFEVLQAVSADGSPSEAAIKSDAQAAYAHALQWVVTGDQNYANKARAILDGWSSTLKRVEPADASQIRLESAWVAPMFAAAAEILRHATTSTGLRSGWSQASIEQTERMLRYLAFNAQQTMYKQNNWGTSGVLAMIAVGVFSDDRRMYEQGVQAWKYLLSKVINSAGVIGEITRNDDEDNSTTDCHHPQYSLIGLSQAAEIAWHQGTDLYDHRIGGESKSRLLGAAEFMVGLFRGGTYVNGGVTYRCTSGKARAVYEIPYNHYRYRLASSQVSSDFTSFITTSDYRADGDGSMFLGWSTFTHGELSRP